MTALRQLHLWRGKYWFIIGAASFLGTAVSSIIRSLAPMSLVDAFSLSIDWFAACVIYFFIGGVFGHLLDWWLLRKQRVAHPLWWYSTIVLLVLSPILLALIVPPHMLPLGYMLFFPIMFGIFFVGAAFYALLPTFVTTVEYAKILLDVVFLAAFVGWVWLELAQGHRTLRRVLLFLVLGTLLLGLVSCAHLLSQAPASRPLI